MDILHSRRHHRFVEAEHDGRRKLALCNQLNACDRRWDGVRAAVKFTASVDPVSKSSANDRPRVLRRRRRSPRARSSPGQTSPQLEMIGTVIVSVDAPAGNVTDALKGAKNGLAAVEGSLLVESSDALKSMVTGSSEQQPLPLCGRHFRCGLRFHQSQRNRERTFFLVHILTRRGDEQKPFRRGHRTRAQKRAAFEQLDLDSAATPCPVLRMIGHPCPPSAERLRWSVGLQWICRRDRPLPRRSPRRRTATSTPPRGVSASGHAWPHSR